MRGAALYWLARIRFHYQPLEITAAQTRAGLEEYQRSGNDWLIALSQELLGDVLLAQGDLPHALDSYWAGLDIRKRLAQADPSNTTAQRNVSVSHNKVGEVLYAQGDLAGALAEYRASLTIRERLAAQDPANAQWQTDLAISCGRVAEAFLALPEGDRAEARRLVAHGLERMEALAQAHPPMPYEQQVRAWLEALREQVG